MRYTYKPMKVEVFEELLACLKEAHNSELYNDHSGDNRKQCSYCIAIKKAEKELR